MRSKMSETKSMSGKNSMNGMKGMKWIVVLLAVFLVAGAFVGAAGADGEHTITVTDDGHGTGSASPTSAAADTPITLTPSPAAGYKFKEWTDKSPSDLSIGADNTFTMPDSAVTVKAVFEVDTSKTFSITVQEDEHGTVTPSKTTACVGETIELTVTPRDGYQFKEWTNKSPSNLQIGTNDTFTMPGENVTVKAVFEDKKYDITVTNDGHGTGSASLTSAAAGTQITLTPSPTAGYKFKEWQVESPTSEKPTITDNTFTMPASAVTVKAIFEVDTSVITTITVSIDAPVIGSTLPSPTISTAGVSLNSDEEVEWTGALDANNKCKAGESYSVSIPVITASGKTFSAGLDEDDITLTKGAGTVSDVTVSSDKTSATIVIDFGTLTNSITSVSLRLTAPVEDASADMSASYQTQGIASAPVVWSPALTANTFAASTEYTATITVTASSGYEFKGSGTASKPTVTLSGTSLSASEVQVSTDKKTLTITHEYPSTKPVLISTFGVNVSKAPAAGESAPTITFTGDNASALTMGSITWDPVLTGGKFAVNQIYTASFEVTIANTTDNKFASTVTVSNTPTGASAKPVVSDRTDSKVKVTITFNKTGSTVATEIESITVGGITAPALNGNVTTPTLSITATSPAGNQSKLQTSEFKWKKEDGSDVTSSTFSEGTYVAEFKITPTADSGVSIKDGATVTAGGKSGTYASSTGKATISYTVGKTEISTIEVSMTAPVGGSAAPTISLKDTTNLTKGNDVKWYEGTSTQPITDGSNLKTNTEYRAVFTVTINSSKTTSHKFASNVTVSGPDCVLSTSSVTKDQTSPDTKVSVTLRFKTSGTEITSVSLTMNTPVVSNSVSNTVSTYSLKAAESTPNYTIDSIRWYNKSASSSPLETTVKFESGKTYTVKITLKAKDGYKFKSDLKASDAKVNSNSADAKPALTDNDKTLTFEYTFPALTVSPVITTFSANTTSPVIKLNESFVTVTFTYAFTGEYTSASIDYGDGSSDTISSASGTKQHNYTTTGSKTAKLTVKGKDGKDVSRTVTLNITKEKLTASFSASPVSGEAPLEVKFTGTTVGAVSSWEWNFGDNSSAEYGKTVTHTFKKAGSYTVTLKVISGGTTSSDTEVITVTKKSSALGDGEPFFFIGDTEVPSPLAIIAEFIHLLQSLFDFENHPLFPGSGE